MKSSEVALLPLLLLLSSSVLFLAACEADPVDRLPPTPARPGEPTLPPELVVPEGSELQRRLAGTCIPFDPWGDGTRSVCLMTTPQDGTLGALTQEGEGLDGGGVAAAMEALRDAPPTTLPRAVDHRTEYLDGCVTISNQQACGWCAVHASTAMLEALHCSKGCDVPELSESHLRSVSNDGRDFGSCAGGWNIAEAAQVLVDNPIAPAATWPYVANGRALNESKPPQTELDDAAVHQVTGYADFFPSNLQLMKEKLASGREVMISIPVFHSGGGRTDWDAGTAKVDLPLGGIPCRCGATGCTDVMCLRGYHAVLVTGYDDDTQMFTFLNSWGREWGNGGYGQMSYVFAGGHGRRAVALDDVRTDVPGATCTDEPSVDGGADAGGDGGVPDGGVTGPGPSDACTAAANCGTCLGLSGCGWCVGEGCQASSSASTCRDWRPTTCSAAGDPCAGWTPDGCGGCLAQDGCQWCADQEVCFMPSLRTVDCNDPRNAPDQCSNCEATDCSTCGETAGCGWCPGATRGVVAPGGMPSSCVPGGEFAADREDCPTYSPSAEACGGDFCAPFRDCGECLDVEGCGWCDGSALCMVGDSDGPVSDESYGNTCGEDWDYYSPFCDNTDDSCANAVSCGECLGNPSRGCGWEFGASRCVPGSIPTRPGIFDRSSQCAPICGDEGAFCGEGCCSGLECVAGTCADCEGKKAVTTSCTPGGGECCGSLECSDAVGGGNNCCVVQRDGCTSDTECCGEMTCLTGNCACRIGGQSCLSSRECCGSRLCTGGTCT